MEQKFQKASASGLVPASSLVVDRRYQILGGYRADTRYGPTVIFKLAETDYSTIKICLPKRYADVIMDQDLDDLNSLNPMYGAFDLVFKGLCHNAVVLKMEKHSST
jgi:hypothetical protein